MNDEYYEWEMHVFFDDAFKDGVQNKYVEFLLTAVQDEGRKWYKKYWGSGNRHPDRYETPYGGRLVWTLPGGTQGSDSVMRSYKIHH